jgi:hypothetical protein
MWHFLGAKLRNWGRVVAFFGAKLRLSCVTLLKQDLSVV